MEDVGTQLQSPKNHPMRGLTLFLLGAICALIILGVSVFFFRKPSVTIKGGDPVITRLRELKRYETSSFTIEQVIEAGKDEGTFKNILFGDKILLIAHGEVIAGFDLSHLSKDDIAVSGSTVHLKLPAPQILITTLDNEKTRVYDRTHGFLTQGNKDLESEARRSAEETIRKAACDGRILETASDNATTQLTALIKAFGFTDVTIEIPRGKC